MLNPDNLKTTQFSWLKLELNVELSHINFILQKTFKAQSEIKIRTVKVILNYYWSIIREKGESQNGCFKKTKHSKFSAKTNTFTPWYAHVCAYQGVKKCLFLRKIWRVLFSWNTCFEIRPFTSLPTYWNSIKSKENHYILLMWFTHVVKNQIWRFLKNPKN